MKEETKIKLSDGELEFVQDGYWILTKQQVIATVFNLFNLQVPVIKEILQQSGYRLPGELLAAVPKISRGENYRGLPWVTLDYPAVFGKEDVFALRTMFWWGHFVSVTLHLSGRYKENLHALNAVVLQSLPPSLFVCVNNNQWHHHFESDNYLPVQECSSETLQHITSTSNYVKFAVKTGLNEWNHMSTHLQAGYTTMIELLKKIN